jgi:integrase
LTKRPRAGTFPALSVASVAQLAEQLTLNQLVLGSSPSRGTTPSTTYDENPQFPQLSPNDPANIPDEKEANVKFPKRFRHKGKGAVRATIYQRGDGYRVYWRAIVNGKPKSRIKDFAGYRDAKREADRVVADLAKGNRAAALTPGQAADALEAVERLQRLKADTGIEVSLRTAVGDWVEAAAKLRGSGCTLGEAIDRFLTTVAVVTRKALADAVAEFIEGRKPLSESKDGKRPKHSPVYENNVSMWLREFAGTFPGYAVCDLTKANLDAYIGSFKELSAKSRNDRRSVVKMLIRWCAAKDYVAQNHRLFEAVDFKTEDADITEIDFYRPGELRDMLNAAPADVLPVIALGGLAGIRREEIMRLEWADVWRVKGKIEISARIAKGRLRRLPTIGPALSAWLRGYRQSTGRIWSKSPDVLEDALAELRDGLNVPARRNGLRRGFVSHHMAMHGDENLTSVEAGHSPQMLHEHYRALTTRAEAKAWFGVRPAKAKGNVVHLDSQAG